MKNLNEVKRVGKNPQDKGLGRLKILNSRVVMELPITET